MGKSIIKDPKGNGSLGGIAKAKNEQDRNDLMLDLITGKFDPYKEKIQKLKDGVELSKPEQEYMDRIEKWKDHKFAKLTKKEVKLSGEVSLFGLGHKELNKNND